MRFSNIGIEAYKYFSELDGNQHIASEFALKKILDIIDKNKIKNILELGLGIGSISYCVLKFSKEQNLDIQYVGTESNNFCLSVLPEYLKGFYKKIKIFENFENVFSNNKFELIIIDGKDESLFKIVDVISFRGIIIIEGDRIPQLELIKNKFPKSLYTRLISNYKSPKYGPFSSDNWCGGIQFIYTDPTIYQKIDFLFHKVSTAFRYRVRVVKNKING